MRPARAIAAAAGALILTACQSGEDASEPEAQESPAETVETVETTETASEGVSPEQGGAGAPGGEAGGGGWSGPPSDQIGAPVALEPVVVEGDDTVVALSGVSAYPGGLDLTVAMRWESERPGGGNAVGGSPMDPSDPEQMPESEDELPDELLRVALVYPDGSTASTADQILALAAQEEPEEPVLNPYQGSGDQESWDQSLWAYPLPDDGDGALTMVVHWPEQGIDRHEVELDLSAAEVGAAAERSVTLWE